MRENQKRMKYRELVDFHFCPIAIETMGPWGEDGRKLINEIGKKLIQSTPMHEFSDSVNQYCESAK